MSLLQSLGHLLGNVNQAGHQSLVDVPVAIAQGINRSTPWGQAHQQAFNNAPQNQPQAMRSTFTPAVPMQHQASPSLRQVVHPQLRVQSNQHGNNLGVGGHPVQAPWTAPEQMMQQGAEFNPGFTPMQGSQGFGTTPQQPQFNPQVRDNGYYWNN